jgi:hypothetical protein
MHGFDDTPGRAFGPLTQSECVRLLEIHSLGRLAWQLADSQLPAPTSAVGGGSQISYLNGGHTRRGTLAGAQPRLGMAVTCPVISSPSPDSITT